MIKRIFTILLILLTLPFVSAWYNESYGYRTAIKVTENAGVALRNYQLKLVMNTQTLISDGKLNADCSDILFTYNYSVFRLPITIHNPNSYDLTNYPVKITISDQNILKYIPYDGSGIEFYLVSLDNPYNTTEDKLPYYIERYDSDLVIWVKVPNLPAGSDVTIYMYYGNPLSESHSDPYSVFLFFDDFEDGVLNNTLWSAVSTYWEENGVLRGEGGNEMVWVCSNNNIPAGVKIEFAMRPETTGDFDSGIRVGNIYFISDTGSNTAPGCINTGFCYPSGSQGPDLNFHEYVVVLQDGHQEFIDLTSGQSTTASYSYTPGQLCLVGDSDDANKDTLYDYIRVRPYADSEPTVTVGTPEEIPGGEAQIPYWVESGCGTTTTNIWVKIPFIPASSTINITMYYGNPPASSFSNATEVFDFYDDFENWEGWEQYQSGQVSQDCETFSFCTLKKDSNNDPSGGYKDIGIILDYPFIFEVREYPNQPGGGEANRVGVLNAGGNGYGYQINFGSSPEGVYIDERTSCYDGLSCGTAATSLGSLSRDLAQDEWHIVQFIWDEGNMFIKVYDESGNLLGSFNHYDTSYRDFKYVYVYGGYPYWIDWIRVRKYVDPEPTYELLPEESQFQFDVEWQNPVPNSYTKYTDFTIQFKVITNADSVDLVELYLDGNKLTEWIDVAPDTVLTYSVTGVSEGQHELYVVGTKDAAVKESTHDMFIVDITPPSVSGTPNNQVIRIHYDDNCITLHTEATDNYGVDYCTVTLWNGTTLDCGDLDICFDPSQPDDTYTYSVQAGDLAGNEFQEFFSFTIDSSQGTVSIASVTTPDRVQAVPFTISITVNCENDWCDNLQVSLTPPAECTLQSPSTISFYELDQYDSATAQFTVSCVKASTYTFSVDAQLANGNSDSTTFNMLPPEFTLTVNPTNPTDDDDIQFVAYPYGYGTNIDLHYRIVRKRGATYTTLAEGDTTIPTDTQTVIYTVSKDDTEPGDEIEYLVYFNSPTNFYEERSGTITIQEFDPPTLLSYSFKYSPNAPDDIPQEATFTFTDNTLVKKVELYISCNTGWTLYDSRDNILQQTAEVTFTINPADLTDCPTQPLQLYLKAYDEFDNELTTNTFQYTIVEDQAPTITIQSPEANKYYNTTTIFVSFKPEDDFTQNLQCTVDSDTFTIQSGQYYSEDRSFSPGQNNLTISCTDEAGNTNTIYVPFTVDITPPSINNISYEIVSNTRVNFTLVATDDIALNFLVIDMYVNGSLVDSQTMSLFGTEQTVNFERDLAPYAGEIVEFKFTVKDMALNSFEAPPLQFAVSKPSPGAPTVVVANMPPRIEIYSPAAGGTYESPIDIRFRVSDESPTVTCELYIDDAKYVLGSVPTHQEVVKKMDVPSGSHTLYIVCRDSEGLQGFSGVIMFNVKAPVPTVSSIFAVDAYKVGTKESSTSLSIAAIGAMLVFFGAYTAKWDLIVYGLDILLFGSQAAYHFASFNVVGLVFNLAMGFIVFLVYEYLKKRIFI